MLELFTLIAVSVYALHYTINSHPFFDFMWDTIEGTPIGNALRCPFCFAFWITFIPSLIFCVCSGWQFIFLSWYCAGICRLIASITEK